jgi:AcrR family transcriptional regulator
MPSTRQGRTPGPRRPAGTPVGPEEVRRAVLEAAALLFAQRGVDAVSLRDIAAQAGVHLALIPRYLGSREELVSAVFDHLSNRVAQAVMDDPLSGQGFEADTVMGMWVRVAAALTIGGRPLASHPDFNPVMAMAATLAEGYGLDELSARVRASQIVAAALGWRIFESYLLEAGDLHGLSLQDLRDDLAHSARRLGATPWPSPPDPAPRSKQSDS